MITVAPKPSNTRQLLLDTALEMLFEEGIRAGVSHIRLQDVVKRAGLTTGAAYRVWENQPAFHHDLVATAVVWRAMGPPTAQTIAAIQPVLESGGSLDDVIRVGSECHVEGVQSPTGGLLVPMEDLVFSLALRIGSRHDPVLRQASQERHRSTADAFTRLYEAMAQVYSRRFVPPFTVDHLAAAFAAVTEGFAVQTMIDIEHPTMELSPRGDEPETWTLLGFVLKLLVDAMTEPVAPPAAEGRGTDVGPAARP